MRQKDKVELERARITKAVRTAIRMKHGFAADDEVNEVLPKVLKEFELSVNRGEAFQLDVKSVFDGSY